jgi:hypothetical protein
MNRAGDEERWKRKQRVGRGRAQLCAINCGLLHILWVFVKRQLRPSSRSKTRGTNAKTSSRERRQSSSSELFDEKLLKGHILMGKSVTGEIYPILKTHHHDKPRRHVTRSKYDTEHLN